MGACCNPIILLFTTSNNSTKSKLNGNNNFEYYINLENQKEVLNNELEIKENEKETPNII